VVEASTVREQFRSTSRAQCDVHVTLRDVENREIAIMTITWRFARTGD
jgi:hypothetical protein